MRYWGIGANWDADISHSHFCKGETGYVTIGWSPTEAPDLYAMLNVISQGDVIYLKKFIPRGRSLRILAIGHVTQPAHDDPIIINKLIGLAETAEEKKARKIVSVHWDWRSTGPEDELQLSLRNCSAKNNVYSNTLYEEYQPAIIDVLNERRSS